MHTYRQRPEAKKRLRQRQLRDLARERDWRVNPTQLPPKRQQAFWARVNKRGSRAGRLGYCWFWTGAQNRMGYGTYGGILAHRVAWALTYGIPVSDGLMLDHLCDTPICTRPSHCREATAAENNAHSRTLRPKATHCSHGHPLSGDNLYTSPKGQRTCRTCQKKRQQARSAQIRQRAGCTKNHTHNRRRRMIGTRRILPNGYVIIFDPSHPAATKSRGEVLEHRKVWYDAHGPIPKGYVIHHKDDNKSNNRLRNLQCLTKTEHMKLHQTTHCSRGHERTPKNTYIYPNGSRHCRKCSQERDRQRKRTKTAA